MIWRLCDGKHSIEEILEMMCNQYPDAEKKTLEDHLNEFLDGLLIEGYLVLTDGDGA